MDKDVEFRLVLRTLKRRLRYKRYFVEIIAGECDGLVLDSTRWPDELYISRLLGHTRLGEVGRRHVSDLSLGNELEGRYYSHRPFFQYHYTVIERFDEPNESLVRMAFSTFHEPVLYQPSRQELTDTLCHIAIDKWGYDSRPEVIHRLLVGRFAYLTPLGLPALTPRGARAFISMETGGELPDLG